MNTKKTIKEKQLKKTIVSSDKVKVAPKNAPSSTVIVKPETMKKGEEFSQRIRIKIKSFDNKIIDQSTQTIIRTAQKSEAKIFGPIPLPTEKRRYTVNRSTFVHKDAKDQYEIRVHKRLVDILDPSAKTIQDLTSLNLPAGVDLEIKM